MCGALHIAARAESQRATWATDGGRGPPRITRHSVAPLTTTCAAPLAFDPSNEVPCQWSAGNATYDLSPLSTTTFYPIQDDRNNYGSWNYTYYINICRNIDPRYFFPVPGQTSPCNPTVSCALVARAPARVQKRCCPVHRRTSDNNVRSPPPPALAFPAVQPVQPHGKL